MSDETVYFLNELQSLFVAAKGDTDICNEVLHEMIDITLAWRRGKLLPRSGGPTIMHVLADFPMLPMPTPVPRKKPELRPMSPPTAADYLDSEPQHEPIGPGIGDLYRHLAELAEENRGLDPSAIKELYNTRQLVVAVWPNPASSYGIEFITLKGADQLLTQAKRGAKKIRATMTAIPCNNLEHAKILQQAFMPSDPPAV